jgi:hypothetical protein
MSQRGARLLLAEGGTIGPYLWGVTGGSHYFRECYISRLLSVDLPQTWGTLGVAREGAAFSGWYGFFSRKAMVSKRPSFFLLIYNSKNN